MHGKFPRGPPEWGEVLWQEPWSFERRTPGKHEWYMIVGPSFLGFFFLIGAFFVLPGVMGWLLAILFIFFSATGFITLVASIFEITQLYPRRVYTKGVVIPRRSKLGYRPEVDAFVPFKDISGLEIEKFPFRTKVKLITIMVISIKENTTQLDVDVEPNEESKEFVNTILKQNPQFTVVGYEDYFG